MNELGRERFMAAHAAWALRQAGDRKVVLVCGGRWHAEAIRRLVPAADGEKPELPPLAGDQRAGSYLVPYDYQRLDRFTGYASGMPSPAYYEEVHARGLGRAADWAESAIVATLRAAGQVASTADRIAWRTHAEALALTRGHRAVLRADLLDAALATLVKDGLEKPAAWTQSGAVSAGTHPALVSMLRAMTGTRRGRLAAGTRRPAACRRGAAAGGSRPDAGPRLAQHRAGLEQAGRSRARARAQRARPARHARTGAHRGSAGRGGACPGRPSASSRTAMRREC